MKRCGKIELMRFVFALLVVAFHGGSYFKIDGNVIFSLGIFDFTFFSEGRIAVEFFFLVSGFLMARSAFNARTREEHTTKLGTETTSFIWRKLKAVLPYSLVISAAIIVARIVTNPRLNLLDYILNRAGGLMFLQNTGLVPDDSFIGVDWYISAMLIAMLVLYPLCRRFYGVFTHVLAPLIGMGCLGYLLFRYGGLLQSDFGGITIDCNFRALGEIALGATCFEFCRWMSGKKFGYGMRTLFTVIEVLCYGLVVLYSTVVLDGKYGGIAVILLMLAVTISFGKRTLLGDTRLFQNRIMGFLGAISLPMFLSHPLFMILTAKYLRSAPVSIRMAVLFGATVLCSIVLYIAWTLIQRAWKNRKSSKATPAV